MDNDLNESRAAFSDAFEELTGWEPADYPSRDVADLCWNLWQAARDEQTGE